MTRHPDVPPFAARLAAAHRMIARGAPPAPVHLADQLGAAGKETQRLADRIGALMPLLEPGRNWRQRQDASPSTAARAYLLAAVLGCLSVVCPHLRKGGPQPAFALLALRRVSCARCAGIVRRPPPGEADRCDVCTARGVSRFHPFACRLGPTLLVGDACGTCAELLGIHIKEAAS